MNTAGLRQLLNAMRPPNAPGLPRKRDRPMPCHDGPRMRQIHHFQHLCAAIINTSSGHSRKQRKFTKNTHAPAAQKKKTKHNQRNPETEHVLGSPASAPSKARGPCPSELRSRDEDEAPRGGRTTVSRCIMAPLWTNVTQTNATADLSRFLARTRSFVTHPPSTCCPFPSPISDMIRRSARARGAGWRSRRVPSFHEHSTAAGRVAPRQPRGCGGRVSPNVRRMTSDTLNDGGLRRAPVRRRDFRSWRCGSPSILRGSHPRRLTVCRPLGCPPVFFLCKTLRVCAPRSRVFSCCRWRFSFGVR